jgi:hypothetical protein
LQILEEGEQEAGGPGSLSRFTLRDDLSHWFQRWRMDMAYKGNGSASQSD